MIKCEFYWDGKCIDSEAKLAGVSECEHCFQGKDANTCALTCDCDETTCNIGEIVNE
jgi:hypothetical protein